jgi:endonuclease V-like protein UPF0215 family
MAPMTTPRLTNLIGFDDAPFPAVGAGPVPVVGAVFADRRLDGVLVGAVRKDGDDAAQVLAALVGASPFREHMRLIMLQGVAFGGFNVVDVFDLHQRLARPVLVVSRRQPDLAAVRRALLTRVPGGEAKWRVIERLGPMEPAGAVYVQRVGLSLPVAEEVVARTTLHGHLPEPLRTAHLIAGALAQGYSRGKP